ncbi:MAG: hypothetical protein REI09_05230 [Candidatus Dactylopiibacterium sp.]|nr:hypothetical protein [Candidatus Dactylopiibacterium sp.]
MNSSMINFGTGKLIAVPTHLADGTLIATPTPVQLGTMQEVSLDLSIELKELYGSKRYPIAVGQGKGKTEIKAKYAEISGAILGSLFFGKRPVAGIKAAVFDFEATVPSVTPYELTVAPPASGTFVTDLGVVDGSTGEPLERVASAPVTGQYALDAATGEYTFAAADAGKEVLISYEYSATGSSAKGQIFELNNETMGYTPSFFMLLQNQYDGKRLICKLNRCVSGQLSLPLKSDDFAVYDFSASAFADPAGKLGYLCLA